MTSTYAQVGSVQMVINSGAPVDGTSGTGAGVAGAGSILFDTANTNFYVNTGSRSSPTWSLLGTADISASLAALADVTAGTVAASKAVIVDANKDASDFRNVGYTGALTAKGGAAAAAVVLRFGDTATEGLEYKVIDEAVTLTNAVEVNLTETVPAGAVILSVQANLATAITGDGSGDDLLAKVGIGVTADPDKYGLSANLNQNTKIDTIPAHAVLAGAETVCVKAAKSDGSACTEKFTAAGVVRVRIVYAVCNSLDNA